MKNLKLFLLTLLSVISFTLFSQIQVTTTNTSGPNVCDGTATLDTTNVNMTSIYWQGMGMIINQGSYMVTNLCPGTYTVTFNSNGVPVTLTFNILAGNGNPCLNFIGFLTSTNSVDSTTCDGVISATVQNGTAPYTYSWSNGVTTQTANNLCPGGYCCYVMDANGCSLQLCDTVGVQSSNYGDTLIINNPGNCVNPIDTLSTTIEDCSVDYNDIYTAYLSTVIPPLNPLDSIVAIWVVVDTNGLSICYNSSYTIPGGFMNQGCYDFQLILHCSQKTMNYKTLIVNETYYLGTGGLTEITGKKKQLMSVVDIMGRETKPESNKILIFTYTDGSKEMRYISE